MMKHLSATNIVRETGADGFASTTISSALTEPKYRDGINYLQADPLARLAYPALIHFSEGTMLLDPHSTPSLLI